MSSPFIKLISTLVLLAGGSLCATFSWAIDGDLTVASLGASQVPTRPQGYINQETLTPYIQSPISPEQYRVRAAQHIYKLNTDKVFSGRMPPLLKAIGVVEIQLSGTGEIKNLKWSRAPLHAPEVMKEIETTLRAAAPYPVTQKGESVVFTETWLWHKSGRFQLLSLTEGQD